MSQRCSLHPGKALIKGPGFTFSHMKEEEAGMPKWKQPSPKCSRPPPAVSPLTRDVLPVTRTPENRQPLPLARSSATRPAPGLPFAMLSLGLDILRPPRWTGACLLSQGTTRSPRARRKPGPAVPRARSFTR